MRALWALILTVAVVFLLVTQRPSAVPTPTTDAAALALAVAPAPAFPLIDRRERMAAAFPVIDRRMADYAAAEHIPGLI